MIEFRTLGTLELTDTDGQEVHSVVAQPKPLALLTLLVLHHPDGFHRRDTLLGLLWPEHEDQRARHALSQALHVLRQALGEGVFLKRGQEEIRIDRGRLRCDAVEFEAAVAQEHYEAALRLYRGDLLEGFFVSEAHGFERWLGNERLRLQELAAGAAWKLAYQRIEQGELVEAERTAQRALSLVATDESEVRRFVEVMASAGDRAAAVRFYEKFAERLRDEYEVEPAPETKQVMEVVRNRTKSAQKVGEAGLASKHGGAPEAAAVPVLQSAKQKEPAVSGRPRKVAVRWTATAAVVTVLAVAVGLIFRDRAPGTAFVPDRVVVALFENQTGDSSLTPVAMLAADWLSDGLAQTGMVEVITPAAVLGAFAAAESQGTPWSGSGGTLALAESMHAGLVVSGRLYRLANDVMIRADVVRMPGVTVLGAIDPLIVAPDDPGPALDTLRQRVMGLLAIHLDPRLATWATTVQRPPTYEAYREFVAGLGLLATPGRALGLPTQVERRERMVRSATLDTTFMAPLIHALRLDKTDMSYAERMEFRESILRVIDQRQHLLTPVEAYEVQALRAPEDRIGNYQAMRRAADLAPDRLNEFAVAAFNVGRYRETIDILERPDLPVGLRPYPWKLLTVSLHFLGEHERELEAARQSRLENPGHRFFMGIEVTALAALGRIDELEATLDESLATGRTTEGTAPLAWFAAGNELLWHGYETEGRAVFERVVAHIRAEPPETQDSYEVGLALLFLGRFEEARVIFEQFASQATEGLEREKDGALAFSAMAAAGLGDRETALRISAQLGAAERLGWQRANNVLHRAMIAGSLGDCAGAVEFLNEALSLGVGHFIIHRRYGLMQCRDYPAFQEVAKPPG